jgi:NAD(P)-dependent dehydrogenase (short-subunit alcohol dehydrogenase family)
VAYCAGIGDSFDLDRLAYDVATFETNLVGLVRTVEQVLPHLQAQGSGVFVGLSSMADAARSATAPAYGASKAGMSRYLEGLSLALRGSGVHLVNVRLGFVDTKMAKSEVRPWLLQPEEASARILQRVLAENPPTRLNIPRRMAVLTSLAALIMRRL